MDKFVFWVGGFVVVCLYFSCGVGWLDLLCSGVWFWHSGFELVVLLALLISCLVVGSVFGFVCGFLGLRFVWVWGTTLFG